MCRFREAGGVFLKTISGEERWRVLESGEEFFGFGDGAALRVEFVELEEGGFVEVTGGEGGFGENVERAFHALAGDLVEVVRFFLMYVPFGEVL